MLFNSSESYGDELFMALIRWQPFQEIETMRRQMDEIFEEMASFKREPQMTWKPAVELQDTEDSVILRAEIPGVEGKDLDIRVTREAVAIAGEHRYEKKAENKGIFRSEFRYGKFQRVIPLPVAVQNDQVQAQFKDGILTLTLPKVTEARRQVVKVNLADTTAATTEPAAEANTETAQAA
jgi:HSP20 family protein